MQASTMQDYLAKALMVTSRAVASRATLPALTHVLLQATAPSDGEGRLKLVATNLDLLITCSIAAQVEQPGAVAVPAHLFTDFVNALPTERVEMHLNPEKQTLHLKCGPQTAKVKGIPADEFPVMPIIQDGVKVSLQAKGLRALLDRVAFAAATEDSRPILTGVLARFENQRVTFAAGDGFRLSVQYAGLGEPFNSPNGGEPFKVVIPVRALQEVMRLMGDQVEPVEIAVNANRTQVRIKLTQAEVGAQLIDGAFPDFTRIIPQTHTSRAVVTSAELLVAVKMLSAIVERYGKYNGVRLEADPRQARLIVIGVHPEQGDGVGEVDAAIEGDAFHVSLQAPYFLNILERLKASPQLAIEFLQRDGHPAPVVVRAVGDDDFLYLMMPLDDTPSGASKATSQKSVATSQKSVATSQKSVATPQKTVASPQKAPAKAAT